MKRFLSFGCFVVVFFSLLWGQTGDLMPQPQSVTPGTGKFRLTSDFAVLTRAVSGERITPGINRFLWQLDSRTGLLLDKHAKTDENTRKAGFPMEVRVQREGLMYPGENESYRLEVRPDKILLQAETDLGGLHGLSTLAQLLAVDAQGFYFPEVVIEDAPRFPWRGLLIDVCRHWMPKEVILRNLDAMAALKMNVLHLHLTEDQGFRVECKSYPRLHLRGSNGNYFTQDELKEIVAYAHLRGIRVVPEFDLPGHATSWFTGYPELASGPGPYSIEKKFGVMDPTLDPTKEFTYQVLTSFFKEMATIFSDPYVHIGGDENNGKQWDANPEIQQFMKDHNLADNHALQAYFNQRVQKILAGYDRYMIGWDEILQPELPNSIVIQSWRGRESLYAAAQKGYQGILSNGYYIDLCKPASAHYLNDPLPADAPLTEAEKAKVLGGEATMWAELVSPETVDSRIWPRTAAIAERFWSPREVNDVKDMYRRLEIVSRQLEDLGLTHVRNREAMMRRMTRGQSIEALAVFVDYVEPLKIYQRHHQGVAYSTDLPLTRLPDLAIPDAPLARKFNEKVDQFLKDKSGEDLKSELSTWEGHYQELTKLAPSAPQIRQLLPLAEQWAALGKIGGSAVEAIEQGQKLTAKWQKESLETLATAKNPHMESELMVITGMEKLINKATQ